MENHMSYLFNNKVGFESVAVDAFGKLQTVSPFTLFDSQHRYDDNEKWDTLVAKGGTATHNPNESTVSLTIGVTSGASVIRETRRVFPYQPGKSLLTINTFAMESGKANLTQRVGVYGNDNGIYLEKGGLYGNSLAFVLRSSVTGTSAETRVYQHEWNGDVLEGSGPSGITLDTTKANILWTDVEWLGVGSVRCGFFFEGRPVVAHTFHNANKNSTTYMTTATLPLRYEIFNGNTASSGSTMRQICSTVISEGGYQGRSTKQSAGIGLTAAGGMKTLTTASTYYSVLSLRLKQGRTDAVVVPSQLNIIAGTKGIYHYRLLLNPTLTGASWTTSSSGTVEFDKSASGFSGGTEIAAGLFNEISNLVLSNMTDFNYQLGRSVGGTADIVTLVIASHGQNQTVSAEIGWEELV
jgi:hypothetical protein